MSISYFRQLSGVVLCGLLLPRVGAHAQSSPTPVPMPNAVSANQNGQNKLDGRPVYFYVEKMPVYSNDGKEGLQAFISSHVRGAARGSVPTSAS
ncbi:hypothetical protein HMJ29_06070 [Hymenobacter taeanensis]|uniref:Uncharacterized protein n=1 Tax=Hymenobacter taeanensis TaxID=2735321 RepID=A0A6M6BHK8_9BACT|nr:MULTISPECIES: hypothetical protein [Hymenobacter]QJX46525.1 hypothetical protein HMJ29_06070 [Hymenobacter taeanensis]UOQ80384.1 hypothetical protein MUN83_16380 [Hymenobacter sp. 5414T-23]